MFTEETLSQTLTARGYKLTQPRLAVLRVVTKSGATLTPAEIHKQAQKICKHTGLVTVYRTLELLAECGAVKKIHAEDGCHTYALASEGHAHHLICEKCHSAVEFENCDLDELLKAVQKKTGYKVQGHWLELFGLCPACR